MGADNKSILTKCGEILINLKTKNKKSKIYQFNCAHCNVHCDQLKKFSKHIENEHSTMFTEGLEETDPEICGPVTIQNLTKESDKPIMYVLPEVKIEELVADNTTVSLSNQRNDPLDEDLMEEGIKNENEHNSIQDCEEYSIGNWEMCKEDEHNESIESELEEEIGNNLSSLRQLRTKGPKRKVLDHESCDDSEDADFDFDPEIPESVPLKPKKKKPQEKESTNSQANIISIDEKELSIALLEAFERQPKLWDVKMRTQDKAITQKYYEIINNEVNEKLKYNIKWKDARKRILQMRFDYSIEVEKQRKDQEYKIPWYAEHMKYLHENIEVLLKGRKKTVDETEISALIDVYKKHESLWQVKNLAFGIGKKKEDAFEEMREQFNEILNLNLTAEHFHRRINYIHRLYANNKRLELKCALEKSDFTPTSPFYKEMHFLSDSHGPFKCSTCNEIIEKYDIYHIHVAKHSNVMPFICPQCQKGFKKFDLYLTHTRRHLGIHNFFCDTCGKGYPFKAELDCHVLSHTGEKPFLCQICGERFRSRHEYNIHLRKHETRFRFECEICKQGFYRSTLYKTHIKMHLNIRDFVCNICGKDYTTKKHLVRHQLIHEDKKKDYFCDVCDKKFAQKSTWQAHQKVHETCSLQSKVNN